jgi:hypothetical protein
MIRAYRKVILRLSILGFLGVASLGLSQSPNPSGKVEQGCLICNGKIICAAPGQCVSCVETSPLCPTCKPVVITTCNNNNPQRQP